MSDVDWNKAPEGAEYYQPNDDNCYEAWYKKVKANSYYIMLITSSEWELCKYSSDAMKNDTLIPRPEYKPVFTKLMADNGDLPSVGMECLCKRLHQEDSELIGCYIIGFSQDRRWLVFEDVDDHLSYHNILNGTFTFKPINTRTDEEKTEATMIESLTNEGIVTYDNIMLKILIEKIKAGKIHNVTWSK